MEMIGGTDDRRRGMERSSGKARSTPFCSDGLSVKATAYVGFLVAVAGICPGCYGPVWGLGPMASLPAQNGGVLVFRVQRQWEVGGRCMDNARLKMFAVPQGTASNITMPEGTDPIRDLQAFSLFHLGDSTYILGQNKLRRVWPDERSLYKLVGDKAEWVTDLSGDWCREDPRVRNYLDRQNEAYVVEMSDRWAEPTPKTFFQVRHVGERFQLAEPIPLPAPPVPGGDELTDEYLLQFYAADHGKVVYHLRLSPSGVYYSARGTALELWKYNSTVGRWSFVKMWQLGGCWRARFELATARDGKIALPAEDENVRDPTWQAWTIIPEKASLERDPLPSQYSGVWVAIHPDHYYALGSQVIARKIGNRYEVAGDHAYMWPEYSWARAIDNRRLPIAKRILAARELGATPANGDNDIALNALVKALRNRSASVRGAAVTSIAQIAEHADISLALKQLERLRSDPDPTVRSLAHQAVQHIECLGRCHGPRRSSVPPQQTVDDSEAGKRAEDDAANGNK